MFFLFEWQEFPLSRKTWIYEAESEEINQINQNDITQSAFF